MRWGMLFWGLLIVVAIAAIVALCLRPATVIGVSEKSLAYSVRGDSGTTGRCREVESDERYVCTTGDGSSDPGLEVVVDVDGFGCWTSVERKTRTRDEGCITIVDLIR